MAHARLPLELHAARVCTLLELHAARALLRAEVEINTRTKTVEQVKRFDHIGATERCATNDEYIAERPPRYAYLMMRGKEEMYSGVAKFDLVEETVVNTISYGESRFGGEAYFQPRPGAKEVGAQSRGGAAPPQAAPPQAARLPFAPPLRASPGRASPVRASPGRASPVRASPSRLPFAPLRG